MWSIFVGDVQKMLMGNYVSQKAEFYQRNALWPHYVALDALMGALRA